MREQYDILRHYGRLLADKNHETTEDNFIRFTAYEYLGTYYIVTMVNGVVFSIAEKEDIRELIQLWD